MIRAGFWEACNPVIKRGVCGDGLAVRQNDAAVFRVYLHRFEFPNIVFRRHETVFIPMSVLSRL